MLGVGQNHLGIARVGRMFIEPAGMAEHLGDGHGLEIVAVGAQQVGVLGGQALGEGIVEIQFAHFHQTQHAGSDIGLGIAGDAESVLGLKGGRWQGAIGPPGDQRIVPATRRADDVHSDARHLGVFG